MDIIFDLSGNLLPGIHWLTWEEFRNIFGFNGHRSRLCNGLLSGIKLLKQAGCDTVYVDGSFVSEKEFPNDFDACWDDDGVDWELLLQICPTLLIFVNQRAAQKARFGGEFFIATSIANSIGDRFLDFFQIDRNGNPKGIVAIDLRIENI